MAFPVQWDDRLTFIEGLIEKYKPLMGLSLWTINVSLKDENLSDDDTCQAQIDDDLKYLEADLDIFPRFWDDAPWKQEVTIIHELAHLILAPLNPFMVELGDNTLESVAQHIAKVIYDRENTC